MTLTLLGCQRLQLGWDCGRLCVTTAVWFLVWALDLSVINALWTYSLVSGVCYLSLLFLGDLALRRHNAELIGQR
jgi:hypothetical protein